MDKDHQRTIASLGTLLAVEAGKITAEDAAAMLRVPIEKVNSLRATTLAAVHEAWAIFEARKGKPQAKRVESLLNRSGWIDSEMVPPSHVKIVSVSKAPCAGCGGKAGTLLFLEDCIFEGGKVGVAKGEAIGPCCLDDILFDDDPTNAQRIAELKTRHNPARN